MRRLRGVMPRGSHKDGAKVEYASFFGLSLFFSIIHTNLRLKPMTDHKTAKKELAELVQAYRRVLSIVEELRDEDVLNSHDCDNILGQLKSGMIEDILMYTRANMTQPVEGNILKIIDEYLVAKNALQGKNLSPEDIHEIMGIFFKK
jgi:hypothetical protein